MDRTISVGKVQMVVLPDGERTWTVLDGSHLVVGPAEEFLEFMRATGRSPNTVKSYARALGLWWEFLAAYGLVWDEVKVEDFGAFLTWLRSGDEPEVASIATRPARFSEETIAVRLQAVMSLYRHHHLNGVEAASRLYERLLRPGGAYRPFLEHVARKRPSARQVVKVKRARPSVPPTLTPVQIDAICDQCARWDPSEREWVGTLRDRLLWALLAETGLRLGEALGLHGEYLFWLCDAGADMQFEDFDAACVFVNLAREPRYQPMRPEPSTGWSAGCDASWLAGCRSGSRRTGSATRTRPRCCSRAFRRMSSPAASGMPTYRRRSTSTRG